MRILLVQLADIGDLVLTTPAIHALREAHPQAHLTLLTTSHSAPLVENTDLINEIITFDRKQFNSSTAFFRPGNLRQVLGLRENGRYDVVVFFHHFTLKLGTLKFALIALASGAKQRIGLQNGNGWFLTESIPDGGFGAKHQAQYWLDLVGLMGAKTTRRPQKITQTAYTENLHAPYVVIHPGSGGYSLARRWDATKFATIADALHTKHGLRIVLVGGKNDDTAAVQAAIQSEAVDLTGKTTLAELAGVIAGAALYIGADSGVMHIAASTGTPIVAIFGPSNHNAWSPWTLNSHAVIIRSGVECSPCSYVGHGIGLREGCPARTCMKLVTVEQVLSGAENILNEARPAESTDKPPTPPQHTRIRILGLPVDAITYAQWLDLIDQWVHSGEPHHVCTTNPEFMMIARRDPNFYNILQRADLCVPDGVGLLWAAKHIGHPIPQRVTGSDGVPIIAESAAEKGWRLFFLGAAPGVADKAADVLRLEHPNLEIVGIYSGSPAPEEEDYIVHLINQSDADILFVAYGAPKQDKWIARNLPRLNVKMAMGVGGSFDFIAGIVPRAPMWMRRAGLEWLYRLYLQPSRIGRMTRLPRFVLAVLFSKKDETSKTESYFTTT